MNFFKNLIFVISFVFLASLAYADSHDTQQTIIDKAKEINKKVKEKQAIQNSNISSEIGKEEASFTIKRSICWRRLFRWGNWNKISCRN